MQTDFGLRPARVASKPSCSKQVSGSVPQILPRDSGPLASLNVCRCGEPLAGDSQGRADDQARVLRRNAGDVNSSTMRGPQGLSGKLLGRRCRSVPRDAIFVPGADEEPWLRGTGELLCSAPRNANPSGSGDSRNYAVAEARTYGQWHAG
jgi:hypothetical protein